MSDPTFPELYDTSNFESFEILSTLEEFFKLFLVYVDNRKNFNAETLENARAQMKALLLKVGIDEDSKLIRLFYALSNYDSDENKEKIDQLKFMLGEYVLRVSMPKEYLELVEEIFL